MRTQHNNLGSPAFAVGIIGELWMSVNNRRIRCLRSGKQGGDPDLKIKVLRVSNKMFGMGVVRSCCCVYYIKESG